MSAVTVTTLIGVNETRPTFQSQWHQLLASGLITDSQQYNNLPPIRLRWKSKDAMSLGLHVEKLLCYTLQDKPIAETNCDINGNHYGLLMDLKQYRDVLVSCSGTFNVSCQKKFKYNINGTSVKGVCDAMLNQVNMLEIKHRANDMGMDQLLHYASLRYLSTGKMTWYITLCNTNKGYVSMFKISGKFYTSGAALRYLEESTECWKSALARHQRAPSFQHGGYQDHQAAASFRPPSPSPQYVLPQQKDHAPLENFHVETTWQHAQPQDPLHYNPFHEFNSPSFELMDLSPYAPPHQDDEYSSSRDQSTMKDIRHDINVDDELGLQVYKDAASSTSLPSASTLARPASSTRAPVPSPRTALHSSRVVIDPRTSDYPNPYTTYVVITHPHHDIEMNTYPVIPDDQGSDYEPQCYDMLSECIRVWWGA